MIKSIFKKGFTLIELLVVISMIGLLSSIVLASLSSARVKASDAAIKADLAGIRTSAEVEYANLGYSYNKTGLPVTSNNLSTFNTPNVVFNNQKIKDAVLNIMKNNGGQMVTGNVSADGKTYNIVAPLKTAGSKNILSSSNNGNITTITGLAAPTGLTINSTSNGSGYYTLRYNWDDYVNSVSVGYFFECKGMNNPCFNNGNYKALFSYQANFPSMYPPRSYTISLGQTFSPGTYTFRVKTQDMSTSVYSPYSDELTITLP